MQPLKKNEENLVILKDVLKSRLTIQPLLIIRGENVKLINLSVVENLLKMPKLVS